MTQHLDEMALEALASGRDDLLSDEARTHLAGCAACGELAAFEREEALDASVALRRAMPEIGELDAMIARAMAAAPPQGAEARGPSRRSLWLGAAFGGLAAAALAVLSLPGASSVSGLGAVGRQGFTLVRAIDSLVSSGVPGGWSLVAAIGLVLALLLALPVRLFLGERRTPGPGLAAGALGLLLIAGLSAPALSAHAYRVEGTWADPGPRITLDVDERPMSEALRLAAAAAGLGLVARLPADPLVTLHVRDVPLADVVQALLGDLNVVVLPSASLITVRPDAAPPSEAPPSQAPAVQPLAPSPPAPPIPAIPAPPPIPALPPVPAAPPPSPPGALGDRVTLGADVEIGTNEVVRAVYTMGGDARILGRAFGDVVTMGGDADVVGEVIGNVTTMGGDVTVREGARVHGDLNAMGGEIDVEDGALVHGQALSASEGVTPSRLAAHAVRRDRDRGSEGSSSLYRWGLWHVLLFLLGLVMMGTARERLTVLRAELGERPIRSALGGFFGLLAGGVLSIVLILTIIGSPGAAVLGTLLFVGVCVGWAAAAWWLGSVLPLAFLKDRPVLQLAVGLGALFVAGLVPKVGVLVSITAALAGLGAVLATRFGAKKRASKRRHVATGPFRDPSY